LFQIDGQPLSYRQIEYRFTQAFKQAGIPFQGTHIVRHAAISEIHANCKDLIVTKSIAGHRDIKSTARYAKAREEAVKDAMAHLQRAESGSLCSEVSHSRN
ncbi:MAG: tyrosine-type recombinase/integrase, partial [Bdellovibrionales bacterium]|nr:tyrosine-type recombinase/integrase [Bdellovibrionales bacterium]